MTRTRPLRRALGAAALASVALAATACTNAGPSASDKDGLDRVTVLLDWTPNTNHSGLYVALERGWYRKAGLDVRIQQPGDTSNLQLLAVGKADVAVSIQEDVTPARAEGLPVQSVAAIIQHNTSSLVSLRKERISARGGLAGKTYGGYGAQLEEALVRRLAQCGGADPGSVKFTDVGEADYRVGLQRGQYDVVWIFDGWDGIRLADLDHLPLDRIELADHTDCIPDWYTPLLATSERMEQQRPEVLERFLAATARGYRTAMTDPSAAADALLAANPDLDAKLVRRSAAYLAPRYADSPQAWGRQDPEVWERFTAFLRTEKILTKPLDPRDAFTNRFLPSGTG